MSENKSKNQEYLSDFIAVDYKRNRICLCSRKNDFKAVKINGIWEKGYPGFDDLMDYFSEIKNTAEIRKYSLEARTTLQALFN